MISTDAKIYEVLALAMRYFFTLLGVMIVWRAVSWLRKDRKQTHKRLKQLPDAGTIGIFTADGRRVKSARGTSVSVADLADGLYVVSYNEKLNAKIVKK